MPACHLRVLSLSVTPDSSSVVKLLQLISACQGTLHNLVVQISHPSAKSTSISSTALLKLGDAPQLDQLRLERFTLRHIAGAIDFYTILQGYVPSLVRQLSHLQVTDAARVPFLPVLLQHSPTLKQIALQICSNAGLDRLNQELGALGKSSLRRLVLPSTSQRYITPDLRSTAQRLEIALDQI